MVFPPRSLVYVLLFLYTSMVSNTYTAKKLDLFFRDFLDIDGFSESDNSLNGIQVDNDGGEIRKIAFAVDANRETFQRAADSGAGMLFVHHGLFWGAPLALSGHYRERVKFLLDRNICLYAVHLPLDQHPRMGNNAVLAELLGLENIEPFGTYHRKKVGCKGILSSPLTVDEAAQKIAFAGRPPTGIFPFGKEKNASCAIISGGAAKEARQAIAEGMDLYITGEAAHEIYHDCLEAGINVIAGGHHSTEVWGVRSVMRHCAEKLNIETEFIDVPTGL